MLTQDDMNAGQWYESLNEDVDEVTVGIYGDEVPGMNSVSAIEKYFTNKGFKVSDVSGDMDYGWEMSVTGNPRKLFFAVVDKIPGYNSDSVQDFIDEYRIDESLKESRLNELLSDSDFQEPIRVIVKLNSTKLDKASDFFTRNISSWKLSPEILVDNSDGTYQLCFPGKKDWMDKINGYCEESVLHFTVSDVQNESLKEDKGLK